MIKLWIAAGVVACAAGLAALRRWRGKRQAPEFSTEPLSGEWLAQARAHEEHSW